MLKIIGGLHRQRILATPAGNDTRPTAAMVREAVFNICQTATVDARCLDLCAGSGAMGLEALSRGAAHVVFVEQQAVVCRCIMRNLTTLKLTEQATVQRGEALAVVHQLARQGKQFDLIYIDPPYHIYVHQQGERMLLHNALLLAIDQGHLLAAGGWLFMETALAAPLPLVLRSLSLAQTRHYGSTQVYIFKPLQSPVLE